MQIIFFLKKMFLVIVLVFVSFNMAFANSDVDFGPYMRELQRRIKLNWQPPKGNVSKSVVTIFSIDKNGELINERILKSSGNQEYDNAALQTLRLTAPFRPLPAKFTGNKVDVQFTFDYNVFGASIQNEPSTSQRQYNPVKKTVEKPIENKEYNKSSNKFDFEAFKKKYNIDYETIRMFFAGIVVLILGLIFIPSANRK